MIYADLISMENQLLKISIVDKPVPIKTAMKLYRNLTEVERALEPCKKMRNDIINKYHSPKPEDENYKDFQHDIEELITQDTEVTFEKVPVEDLEKMELTMHQIAAIYPMIDEGGETNG